MPKYTSPPKSGTKVHRTFTISAEASNLLDDLADIFGANVSATLNAILLIAVPEAIAENEKENAE